jgi:hypothetical protein
VGDVVLAVGRLLQFVVELRLARGEFGALRTTAGASFAVPASGGGPSRSTWACSCARCGVSDALSLSTSSSSCFSVVVQIAELDVARGAGGLLLDAILLGLQALEFGNGFGVREAGICCASASEAGFGGDTDGHVHQCREDKAS